MSVREQVGRDQAALARFLADPAYESLVRADPPAAAHAQRVSLELVQRLAAIDPRRVAAFRASARHKNGVRANKGSGR